MGKAVYLLQGSRGKETRDVKDRALLLAVCLVLVDQALKAVVERVIPVGYSIPVVPGILSFTHVVNPGLAFGLFRDVPPVVAVLLTLTTLLAFLSNSYRWRGGRMGIAFSLILGGALGNLLDRLRVGHVVDYLDLRFWPVFNLADVAVTLGMVLLLVRIGYSQKQGGAA